MHILHRLAAIIGFVLVSILPLESHAVVVTVGGTGVKDTAGDKKWLTYQANVEAAGDADLEMRMLIYGELGSEDVLVNGIRRGRIQVANWSGLATTIVVPEMAMLYTPFLFDNYSEADFIMDNYLFAAYSKLLAEQDVHLIQWDEIGFNQVYGKTPIIAPVDAQGVRFRTSSSESARLFAEAIGADAIPLGFMDIVTGLQTGLVDSGESAIIMYVPTGISGEANHLTLTDHSFATSIIVMKKSWIERRPEAQKRILLDSFIDVNDGREWTRDEWKTFLDENEKWGFTTHRIATEQRDVWKEAVAPVSRRLIDGIGGDAQLIWDLVQEGKAAFAAQQDNK
ncbi:MAG: TRAP transporter substrate-binding protein DctP [Rhodospirillaceae bacterium]|nr:TRAP transporter substrate-binding protein DctP [Rhodospirillaceae bacterium]MBT5565934.1 TRAP transporter substrate-binding protein DctP [Rhodospirillaceae bacterium]MBT6088646.1 TRAP transporter substrate-binding protein DctP [Rhodospirillaceae bacterium]